MDKCPKCGAEVSWTDERSGLSPVGFGCLTFITSMGTVAESVECVKRQLAAANERAGRLEEALDFYAKPDSWEYGNGAIFAIVESPAFVDAGEVARKALEVPDAL